MLRTGESGFTLLELLVVLALIGLMLGVVPAVLEHGSDRAMLGGDAARLTALLDLARSEAIVEARSVSVPFNMPEKQYGWLGHQDNFADNITVVLDVAATQSENGQRASIQFYPDGSSSGGRIELSNKAGRRIIDVDWLTGRVTSRMGDDHAP